MSDTGWNRRSRVAGLLAIAAAILWAAGVAAAFWFRILPHNTVSVAFLLAAPAAALLAVGIYLLVAALVRRG